MLGRQIFLRIIAELAVGVYMGTTGVDCKHGEVEKYRFVPSMGAWINTSIDIVFRTIKFQP